MLKPHILARMCFCILYPIHNIAKTLILFTRIWKVLESVENNNGKGNRADTEYKMQ